jgi:hypothetical protein
VSDEPAHPTPVAGPGPIGQSLPRQPALVLLKNPRRVHTRILSKPPDGRLAPSRARYRPSTGRGVPQRPVVRTTSSGESPRQELPLHHGQQKQDVRQAGLLLTFKTSSDVSIRLSRNAAASSSAEIALAIPATVRGSARQPNVTASFGSSVFCGPRAGRPAANALPRGTPWQGVDRTLYGLEHTPGRQLARGADLAGDQCQLTAARS